MGTAMTRCVAALARKAVRKCKHGPMSATDAREEPSAVLTPRPGFAAALPAQPLEPAVTARTFATKMVSRHPGDRPAGQDFSLFINTLKLNLSGIILAFD
jgi:hypothetical protein